MKKSSFLPVVVNVLFATAIIVLGCSKNVTPGQEAVLTKKAASQDDDEESPA